VLHHRWGHKPGYRFERAFHWFLLANRDGRYSGSAITSLNEDVRAINEAESFEKALESLGRRLRTPDTVDATEFLNRYDRAAQKSLALLLYLVLFRNGAEDWVDRTRVGYDKSEAVVRAGFEPQWHHIYPRSVLRKVDVKEDDINALANVTVLNEKTNVNRLAAKEPWRYIHEFDISPDVLRAHLVPPDFLVPPDEVERLKERWGVERFHEFMLKRAELLAREVNSFLEELRRK